MRPLIAWLQHHGLRAFAAMALAALTIALAFFNVAGWLTEGLLLLAILAACFEAIGFVFAVLTEDAARARRFDRAAICLCILVGSALFNTVGGHRAWEASMRPREEEARRTQQAALDAERRELQAAIAAAAAEIERVPLPRPDAYTGRQEAALATWREATSAPRQRQAAAQGRLDTLAVIASPAPEFDERTVWAFLAFLEFAKALGLWAIGMNAKLPARTKLPAGATVSSFDASEAARRLVGLRRDRQPAAA